MSDQPSEPRFPVYVDTRRVFEAQSECSGKIALDRLPRLQEHLASDSGIVEASLRFFIGEYGDREIGGYVKAALEVPCQRCLEPLSINVEDQIHLALVKDDEQAAKLRAELDPWICNEIKLPLAELVEEQILLSLPIVCTHSADECQRQMNYAALTDEVEQGTTERKNNPFAVLGALKKSD